MVIQNAQLRSFGERGGGLKTPTAIDRRPVFLGSWAAIAEDIADQDSLRLKESRGRKSQDEAKLGQEGL